MAMLNNQMVNPIKSHSIPLKPPLNPIKSPFLFVKRGGPCGPAFQDVPRLMLLAAKADPWSTTSKGRTAISIAEACDEARFMARGLGGVAKREQL